MHTHRNCYHYHYVIRLWLPPVWLSCRHLEISCKWVCWWRRKIRPRDSTLLIRWELVCAWLCTHTWVNTCTTHTHTHTDTDTHTHTHTHRHTHTHTCVITLPQTRTFNKMHEKWWWFLLESLKRSSSGLAFIPHPSFPSRGRMATFPSWYLVIKGQWLLPPTRASWWPRHCRHQIQVLMFLSINWSV